MNKNDDGNSSSNKIKANALSYTTYLSTLAKAISRNPNIAQKKQMAIMAQQILDNSNNDLVNTWTYNSVLHCWSAAGDVQHGRNNYWPKWKLPVTNIHPPFLPTRQCKCLFCCHYYVHSASFYDRNRFVVVRIWYSCFCLFDYQRLLCFMIQYEWMSQIRTRTSLGKDATIV